MSPRSVLQCLRHNARCHGTTGIESVAGRSQITWAPSAERAFSATSVRDMTKLRRNMFTALDKLEMDHKKRGPHYVGGELQPYPDNPLFKSQPVLDEDARETIWRRVVQQGEAMKVVSADMGVDMRRVAAVVRMKIMEKQWLAQGKPLAKPYSKAMLDMLPTTSYSENAKVVHESINDVHVHSYTMQQVFLPTSESRQFTRYDAANAFHRALLPAEERTMHKELIKMEQDNLVGANRTETMMTFRQNAKAEEMRWATKAALAVQKEEARTRRVQTDRFEFRFKDFNSENVGRDGRKRKTVGWRYGAPLDDRKKGKVRIPTKVPAAPYGSNY